MGSTPRAGPMTGPPPEGVRAARQSRFCSERSVAAAPGVVYARSATTRAIMQPDASHPERDKAWSMPLEQIDPSKGYLFEHDYRRLVLRAAAPRRPGAPGAQQALRPVLVGDHATRTSWRWTPTTPPIRRTRTWAASRWPSGRRRRSSRASSRWTRRATTSSARRSARSSRRATWRCWKPPSASAPRASSTACPSARNSTGCSGCRSS